MPSSRAFNRARRGREVIEDAGAIAVIEERGLSASPTVCPRVAGSGPIGPGVIEEAVGARVISENERIGVGPDGTLNRQYERVEQERVQRRRRFPQLAWALLVLLALVLAGLAVWWYFSRAQTKQVPGVTGVPLAAAVTRLQDRGFHAGITSQSHREKPGIVYAQNPVAGQDAKKGSTVQINVSKGPATVVVPNAIGLAEATARDRIAAAGFQVVEARYFSQQPAGNVVAQSPAAGGKAAKGSTIQINVSKGTGIVIVPNVVGQTLGGAQTQLAKAGLNGAVQFRVPSAQPVGTVVAQNPPGGQARHGSTVELNVSRGPS